MSILSFFFLEMNLFFYVIRYKSLKGNENIKRKMYKLQLNSIELFLSFEISIAFHTDDVNSNWLRF